MSTLTLAKMVQKLFIIVQQQHQLQKKNWKNLIWAILLFIKEFIQLNLLLDVFLILLLIFVFGHFHWPMHVKFLNLIYYKTKFLLRIVWRSLDDGFSYRINAGWIFGRCPYVFNFSDFCNDDFIYSCFNGRTFSIFTCSSSSLVFFFFNFNKN